MKRLQEARSHYRSEVVGLTTRLSQEGGQLRAESGLLQQTEQRVRDEAQQAVAQVLAKVLIKYVLLKTRNMKPAQARKDVKS